MPICPVEDATSGPPPAPYTYSPSESPNPPPVYLIATCTPPGRDRNARGSRTRSFACRQATAWHSATPGIRGPSARISARTNTAASDFSVYVGTLAPAPAGNIAVAPGDQTTHDPQRPAARG